MATYTSNYGWTKPSRSDNVDISVLNNNLDDQDSTIHDAFLNMAPPFSESSTYAVDDIVLYGTGLYKCHTAVVTPGSWTGSTNWQVYKLSEGGSGGGGTLEAGDYINIENNVISVTKKIGDFDNYKYELTAKTDGRPHLEVKKYINDTLASTTSIPNDGQVHNVDDMMTIGYTYGQYTWDLTLLEDSVEHDAGYTESWSYQDSTPRIFNFEVATDPSTTLVTKGDLTAGNITYDNTDSGLTATDVQGAVDEVAERINSNILGTDVDISSYTSANPYVAPSDGYIRGTGTESGSCIIMVAGITALTINNTSIQLMVYVKKGMSIYPSTLSGDSSAVFFPLS